MLNYFEFGPVVQQEMSFIRFFIWNSGGPRVQRSGTIYAILVEGIMGDIHVKLLFKFGPMAQEDMSFKEKVYGRTTRNGRRTKTNHNSSH